MADFRLDRLATAGLVATTDIPMSHLGLHRCAKTARRGMGSSGATQPCGAQPRLIQLVESYSES